MFVDLLERKDAKTQKRKDLVLSPRLCVFASLSFIFCLSGVGSLSSLSSLEVRPWFHEMLQLDFETAFSYRIFSDVQGACRQPSSTVHDRNLAIDLGFTPLELLDVRFEGEFAKTNAINWGMRSGAMQARLGLMDDISGDLLSLTLGLNIRGATHHFLKSVATPYASEFNTEVTCALGKEWSWREYWQSRLYGYLAAGQGNRGYPWLNTILGYDWNVQSLWRFSIEADSLIGFGGKDCVDVERFRGWAKFQYRAIDLGTTVGLNMGVYGVLSASYAYRVFARNFPKNVHALTISYQLPFSLF